MNYNVAVQTPQYRMQTLDDLRNTPISLTGTSRPQLLGNLATIRRSESPEIVNHYDVQPVYDVLANSQSRDLGGVGDDIQRVIQEYQPQPSGWRVLLSGSALAVCWISFTFLSRRSRKCRAASR